MNLTEFEAKWEHPSIGRSWRRKWACITPLFAYPPEIRKVIYTTNAIESLNLSLRKVTKNRGSFPNDAAMFKLLYLAIEQYREEMDHPLLFKGRMQTY